VGKLSRDLGKDRPPIVRPRELPEPDPFDAEAHLDRLAIQHGEVVTGGDAGTLEQPEQRRRWSQNIDRKRSDEICVATWLHKYAIRGCPLGSA
jgi:hypothetical protein